MGLRYEEPSALFDCEEKPAFNFDYYGIRVGHAACMKAGARRWVKDRGLTSVGEGGGSSAFRAGGRWDYVAV